MKAENNNKYPYVFKLATSGLIWLGMSLAPLTVYGTYFKEIKELRRDINEVNYDIRYVSEYHNDAYALSVDNLQNSPNLYVQFKSKLQDRDMAFNSILGTYKPHNTTWNSFEPLNQHRIDRNDPIALEQFLGFAEGKRDALQRLQDETHSVASDIEEAKVSFSFGVGNSYPYYHHNRYYTPYRYQYYHKPYSYKHNYYYKPHYYKHNYYKPWYKHHYKYHKYYPRHKNKGGVYFNHGPYGNSAGVHFRIK